MKIFDSHFHIIDYHYPLVPNNGYMPPEFTCQNYQTVAKTLNITAGAIVSGSFQAFDQSYLIDALNTMGNQYVGVTQLPASVTDHEIVALNSHRIRAVRFNIKRGGSAKLDELEVLAKRVYEIAKWHVELYIDSNDLEELYPRLITLPKLSIDHLGLAKSGFPHLLKLVEKNTFVKATGFGRIDFDPKSAMKQIMEINPSRLMFGTDLPSTRAARPFCEEDISLILNTFDSSLSAKILGDNAFQFYGLSITS